jgi:lipid II isoglutaminyl synthase (glutamine-hydrolysing)
MTDRVGRHAAAPDADETTILPAQRRSWEGSEAPRARGRHAAAHVQSASGESGTVPTASRKAQGGRAPGLAPAAGNGSADGGVPGHVPIERREPSRGSARSGGELRLVWVFPDLLSTYGDRGNLLVLRRRAHLRGIAVESVEVNSDQPVPRQGDVYLLGGGEDLPQILAANRLRADGGLRAAAESGAVVFAVCAGYQVIGRRFGGVEGEPVDGLGILDISSGRGERRGVGEIRADVAPTLGVPALTGFENHQGITRVGPGARPLARVTLGVGNGDGTEGAYAGQVLGTYLHGPALARNPGLADLLLSWAVGPLQPLDPEAEEWAGRLRAERLAATGS